MNPSLPSWLHDMIDNPPTVGHGINKWLYRVSRQLHAHYIPEKIKEILVSKTQGAILGRIVQDFEITRAINRSLAVAWAPDDATPTQERKLLSKGEYQTKWPPFDEDLRREIIGREGFTLADIWDESPIRIEGPELPSTDWFIDQLFPSNPWLCVGKSMEEFQCRKRELLRGKLSDHALIVPSPMLGQMGKTQGGYMSEHSLEGTGPRKFLVVEFDNGTMDEQSSLIIHLATMAALVMVVHSGGKSLHSWFNVQGDTEESTYHLLRYAVSLGADDATHTKSQFVRIPQGTRNNGPRQLVYFFNPEAIKEND